MKKIIQLIIGVVLLSSFCSYGQDNKNDYFDGQLYMKIKDATYFNFDTNSKQVNINEKLSFLNSLVDKYKISKVDASFYFSRSEALKRTFRIYFEEAKMVDQFLFDLKGMEQVEYAEKIPVMRTTYTPNDLKPNTLGSSNGQYGLYNIKAKDAWDVARGNSSVVIAVVDNGIDISHSDLAGLVSSSRDVSDSDNDPSPSTSGHNHGTHCSGIACANTDNGIGIASIGFGCSLMAIKATANSTTSTQIIDDGYEGIEWASSHGADIISCSWGGSSFSLTNLLVISSACSNDAVVVAAAGNDGASAIHYPAGYVGVLSVASVDISDKKATSSNFGSWVDVAAPGVSIYSTLPGNSYGSMSGTSMATPLVAGLCGLVRSLDPSLSYDEVVNCVTENADDIDAINPTFSGQLGSGRINAFQAVQCSLPCNGSINLGTGNYSVLKTESSGSITSGNNIASGKQVTFDAESIIYLMPGFTAQSGCVFHAYIDGCGGSFRLPSDNPSHEDQNINAIDDPNSGLHVKCFPNPFSSIIHIKCITNHTRTLKIDVLNLQGKNIKSVSQPVSEKGSEVNVQMNLENLPQGFYFLKVSDGTFTIVEKIIKS